VSSKGLLTLCLLLPQNKLKYLIINTLYHIIRSFVFFNFILYARKVIKQEVAIYL